MSQPETIDLGEFKLDDAPAPALAPVKQPHQNQVIAKLTKAEIKNITSKPEPTSDDIEKHQEHVLMLSRYGSHERFSEYLGKLAFELKPATLKKKSLNELTELLQRVRTSVSNKNVSDVFTELSFGAIHAAETIVTVSRLGETVRLKGITDVLKEDETFLDLLSIAELENQNLSYVSPYIRMIYTVATAGMKVHAINQMMHNANNPKIQDKPTVQPTVQPTAPITKPTEEKQTKPKRKKDNEIVYTMD